MAGVQPVPNGGIPPRQPALELKLTFKDGGAVDFHTQFVRIKERMQQAVDVARQDGRSTGSAGVNMDAVHLEQLPAYEEASASPVPVRSSNTSSTAQSLSPAPIVQREEQATHPPAEPPPGYEQVQRDSLAESLDRDLRPQH